MWSSRGVRGIAFALVLLAAPALTACSGVTPVYGPQGIGTQKLALAYAKPTNRFEQVIYEDLALKLGKASGPAPTLSISATAFARDLTSESNTNNVPAVQRQEQLSAAIKLTDVNGKLVFSGMRSASADFTTNSQGLASNRAEQDAAIRAAHALAETIRLTLLGILTQ